MPWQSASGDFPDEQAGPVRLCRDGALINATISEDGGSPKMAVVFLGLNARADGTFVQDPSRQSYVISEWVESDKGAAVRQDTTLACQGNAVWMIVTSDGGVTSSEIQYNTETGIATAYDCVGGKCKETLPAPEQISKAKTLYAKCAGEIGVTIFETIGPDLPWMQRIGISKISVHEIPKAISLN